MALPPAPWGRMQLPQGTNGAGRSQRGHGMPGAEPQTAQAPACGVASACQQANKSLERGRPDTCCLPTSAHDINGTQHRNTFGVPNQSEAGHWGLHEPQSSRPTQTGTPSQTATLLLGAPGSDTSSHTSNVFESAAKHALRPFLPAASCVLPRTLACFQKSLNASCCAAVSGL